MNSVHTEEAHTHMYYCSISTSLKSWSTACISHWQVSLGQPLQPSPVQPALRTALRVIVIRPPVRIAYIQLRRVPLHRHTRSYPGLRCCLRS